MRQTKWCKPHIYRAEGWWTVFYKGRRLIWRNTRNFREVREILKAWRPLQDEIALLR